MLLNNVCEWHSAAIVWIHFYLTFQYMLGHYKLYSADSDLHDVRPTGLPPSPTAFHSWITGLILSLASALYVYIVPKVYKIEYHADRLCHGSMT